ncbi:MAG: transglutaminase domain-containing protein [Reyranella sp.]|nr:MAG: transglutaminase domain-containing protein [Reyranella sp.]
MTAPTLDGLPRGPAALAGIVQGLLIHEHIAGSYGVDLSQEQHGQAHVRSVEGILAGIKARDPAPLASARAPAARQVGVCSHFALMHATLLRAQGIEARARCGFGAYFETAKFVDHWVTEYWNAAEKRWVLVDSQIDDHQRKLFGVDFDLLDVPRDKFLVAGDAWQLCREGKLDPKQFGVMDMWGLWFVGSNVIRDIASLAGRTMLPWDVWGAMTQHDTELDLALIDRLAALSAAPDADPAALRAAYADPRVTVPASVFNAVLKRVDAV